MLVAVLLLSGVTLALVALLLRFRMSDYARIQAAVDQLLATNAALRAEGIRNRTLLTQLLDAAKGNDQARIDALAAQIEGAVADESAEVAAVKAADDAAEAAQAPAPTPAPVVDPVPTPEPAPVEQGPADPTPADSAPASAEPNP